MALLEGDYLAFKLFVFICIYSGYFTILQFKHIKMQHIFMK